MTDFSKPLILVDLDDTLFQTYRRIPPQADFQAVTTDQHGQNLSYMSPKQQQFVKWLWQSGKVIAVTARSPDALKRVRLDFQHGAICSHGGTLLNGDLSINQAYQAFMREALATYQAKFAEVIDTLQHTAQQFGSIRTWIVEEQGLQLYAVAKQNHTDAHTGLFLMDLYRALPKTVLADFYCHANGNNLAIIPKPMSKASAVDFYLNQILKIDEKQFILGYGDSLSDLAFLTHCDWWGVPKTSQITRWTQHHLNQDYQQYGYFGDYHE